MPRKRKTRGVTNQTTRPKATLPEGDEGNDLKPEDRRDKLLVMIADFENEVKNRIENLENQKKTLPHRIRATYTVELMKIPKHIRGMKISEYLKTGGKVNDESEDEDGESRIDAKVQSVKEEIQRKPLATVNEEIDTTQKARPPTGRRGRAAANKSALMPPPSTAGTRKTRQRMFETPAQQKKSFISSRPGFETPLVTPKFDTRLPITPAIGRNPRPNEKIMSISGSPIYLNNINNRQKHSTIFEVLQSGVDVEDIVHNIDDHTMNDLVQLQEKLSKIIGAKQ